MDLLSRQDFTTKTEISEIPSELSNVGVAVIARIAIDHCLYRSSIRVELL
jgi:hypothetical protein